MHIVPVLDLMGGLVVRGVAGRRDEYRPVQSRWCHDARPAGVAQAFVNHFGFTEAYVADLDTMAEHREPAWATYEELIDAGLKLWVDAGLRDPEGRDD